MLNNTYLNENIMKNTYNIDEKKINKTIKVLTRISKAHKQINNISDILENSINDNQKIIYKINKEYKNAG